MIPFITPKFQNPFLRSLDYSSYGGNHPVTTHLMLPMRSDVAWRRDLLRCYKAQRGSSSNSIYVWYDWVGRCAVKAFLRLLLVKYQEWLFLCSCNYSYSGCYFQFYFTIAICVGVPCQVLLRSTKKSAPSQCSLWVFILAEVVQADAPPRPIIKNSLVWCTRRALGICRTRGWSILQQGKGLFASLEHDISTIISSAA